MRFACVNVTPLGPPCGPGRVLNDGDRITREIERAADVGPRRRQGVRRDPSHPGQLGLAAEHRLHAGEYRRGRQRDAGASASATTDSTRSTCRVLTRGYAGTATTRSQEAPEERADELEPGREHEKYGLPPLIQAPEGRRDPACVFRERTVRERRLIGFAVAQERIGN